MKIATGIFFKNGHAVFLKNTVLEDLRYLWTWAESSTLVQLSSALEKQTLLMKLLWRREGANTAPMLKACAVTQLS